jgi:hypothetical protein
MKEGFHVIKYAIAIAFIIATAFETKSYAVTTLVILFFVYFAVQDKVNRALLTAQDEQLEVVMAMSDVLKKSAVSQRAYADHVGELRAMLLGVRGKLSGDDSGDVSIDLLEVDNGQNTN